jgi:carbonic anhydrase/acetyltransferase-like protein (isoleucine patch superfamily)
MTVRSLGGVSPRIAGSAWVSEAAYVAGDVEIGEGSTVWPGAVIRADLGPIRIGANTHVEDNCVVHAGEPLEIGDNVIFGHGVIVHGRRVGSNCLIGNNATLLDHCAIGEFCIVAAGAVVLAKSDVPQGSFITGVPGVAQPVGPARLAQLERQANSSFMTDLAKRYQADGL